MQMKSVCVQWHMIFIAHKLQEKGFFHCTQLCIAPLWRLLVLTFQWKGRQVSCKHWHRWLPHNADWWWTKCTAHFFQLLPSIRAHLSVPCHCQTVDQQCHLWRAAKHFTLSHLLMRVCVTVQAECLCSCHLLSYSLFHILPPLTGQSTIKCPTLHSFQVYTSATLKFCLLFFFVWLTTVQGWSA